jgi:hypothetical protein
VRPGITGYSVLVSIPAISAIGAAPITASALVPLALPAARAALPVATPVATPTTGMTQAATSVLTGDAGEVVQSNGAAVLSFALIAYAPIRINAIRPAIPAVLAVLPAGFTPIDTYA